MRIPASIGEASVSGVGPRGEIAHRELIAHTERLRRRLWRVNEHVHCMVGNGLANISFVEAPDGLVVIDTGECVEECAAALAEVRKLTQAPIAAAIYTHFHYVSGTAALLRENPELEIWGHEGIVENRRRMGFDVGPAALRGLVAQFGVMLPAEGADAPPNVGLGLAFSMPQHAPHTPGFVPAQHEIRKPMRARIAGLDFEFTPAPSDADDSITVWIPEYGVCINNLVWPALFNVFAIRGEEYRDPRVLLTGLDHVLSLEPEHLVGVHGPPLSGAAEIQEEVTDYRDSIQFLWDQTVRGLNRGLSLGELTEFVQLPERFRRSYRTTQLYGLVEHHVRQIHAGLRGWFDGDTAALFPLHPADEAARIVEAFGGRDSVLAQIDSAVKGSELRWAVRLGTWLLAIAPGDAEASARTAEALRTIAQRTTSSNIRNWCLTRAPELEGKLDLTRFRIARLSRGQVISSPPEASVHALRVQLDPARASGAHEHLRFEFEEGTVTGLRVRDGVAIPSDGEAADLVIRLSHAHWADLCSGRQTLRQAVRNGDIELDGGLEAIEGFLARFDNPSFELG